MAEYNLTAPMFFALISDEHLDEINCEIRNFLLVIIFQCKGILGVVVTVCSNNT